MALHPIDAGGPLGKAINALGERIRLLEEAKLQGRKHVAQNPDIQLPGPRARCGTYGDCPCVACEKDRRLTAEGRKAGLHRP